MNDCLFCKIIARKIPAQKIYEDENTFAFLDINPVKEGHLLVVPKTHATNVFDIAAEDWGTLMETVRKLSSVVRETMEADGVNLHINNEVAAGQAVFHPHIHIIPRHTDDGLELWHGAPYEEGRAEEIQEKFKNAMV